MTLLLAGAMASLDRQHIEAARNLGAPRLRVLFDIVLPQVRGTLLVGLVLSFVTMLSVLSVPLMINPNSPTMITVDIAYRINTHVRLRRGERAVPHVARARGGRRVVLPAARGRARRIERDGDDCRAGNAARIRRNARRRRSLLGAARVRDLRAARQPRAVGVRREAGTSRTRSRQEFGLSFWARVFSPRGGAVASLGTSVWIAILTVIVSLAVAIPAGLRARARSSCAGAG